MGKRRNKEWMFALARTMQKAPMSPENRPMSAHDQSSANTSALERLFLFLENGITLAVMGIIGGFAGVFIDGKYFLVLCIPLALGLHRSGALKGLHWAKATAAYALMTALSGIVLWRVGEGVNQSREHIPTPQEIA